MLMQRLESPLGEKYKQVAAIFKNRCCIIDGFNGAAAVFLDGECTQTAQKLTLCQLFFVHHKMQLTFKYLEVDVPCKETIPPAKMVADQQYRMAVVYEVVMYPDVSECKPHMHPEVGSKEILIKRVMFGFDHQNNLRVKLRIRKKTN